MRVGDPLTSTTTSGRIRAGCVTRTADFVIAAIVPIAGAAADRDLAPVYPGITAAETLGDWDPPFPIDLQAGRPVDEAYWKQYRTTPKAFIPFEDGPASVGIALRRSNVGSHLPGAPAARSATRAVRARRCCRQRSIRPRWVSRVQTCDERAGRVAGSTDFGEYFTYFSFFLVASALLLAALFFRLGVEQRAREVGLLRAVGFTARRVRRLFAAEGLLLARRRQRDRHRRRVGYGAADDGRPAHVVVGRGRHHAR